MRAFLVLFFTLFAFSACQPKTESKLIGTDLTGTQFGKPLSLTDHNGKLRTMADFKDKVVVLFFGYTHCPDVCPTTMNDLKQAMRLLGGKSDQVQVLFVTVDPERDTKEVLAQFVPSFDPRFIGLGGTPAEVAANMAEYKVYAAKVEEKSGNYTSSQNYTVDHSAGMYVFDKTGAPRIYMSYGQRPADIVHDIAQLL